MFKIIHMTGSNQGTLCTTSFISSHDEKYGTAGEGPKACDLNGARVERDVVWGEERSHPTALHWKKVGEKGTR